MPLDEETRTYLKRMRRANPNALLALPEGFYDTDDEEESREKFIVVKDDPESVYGID